MADERSNGVVAVIRAARPSFRNKHDKVAFAVHATFLAAGYYLTAAGPSAYEDDALTSSSTEEVGIDRWNELEDEYAFVYAKPASAKGSRKVLIKCLAVNDKLVVNALEDGVREPVHIEIDVDDFSAEDTPGNYSAQYKDLGKLVKNLDRDILSKFAGSSGSPSSAVPASSITGSSDRSRHIDEPGGRIASEPWGPQIQPSGVVLPPVYPGGSSDTFPGSGTGYFPTRGGFIGDGSMLVGPNDPRFFGSGGQQPSLNRGRQPCSF
ncbi:hypothetical protein SAY87_009180 [Trapa incisa]|uniref:PI31 proteasome regulator N-terminal domain-containing protein n=1 Tax=Trapa incisa TaxID=236973 RepID=A0AAN7K1A6_9MYRT|nr:hypothetical protein SAY87_009180 [Trapa incisa]